MTPIKAIRAKCRECTGGSTKSIRLCQDASCPLWPYRFGMTPKTARKQYGHNALQPQHAPTLQNKTAHG